MLRPQFTQLIFDEYVMQHRSLNLICAAGSGRTRFIDDLKTLGLGVVFEVLDMRRLRKNYDTFLRDLASPEREDDLEALLLRFGNRPGHKVLIVHRLEYLFKEGADKRYNFAFFNALNSFKNADRSSLLVLSAQKHTNYACYDENGELTSSPLELDLKALPPLLHNELKQELHRRVADMDLREMAARIQHEPRPYELLCFITNEIRDGRYDTRQSVGENYAVLLTHYHKLNRKPWSQRVEHFYKKYDPWMGLKSVITQLMTWYKDAKS